MSGPNTESDSGFSITTGDLAGLLGAELSGSRDVRLSGIEALEEAGSGDLSFVRSSSYAGKAAASKAGALLVSKGVELPGSVNAPTLVVDDADRALVAILSTVREHRLGPAPTGVHPSAAVDDSAELHPSVAVGANAVIERGVRVGEGTSIGPGAVLRAGTRLGARCVIGPNVVIGHEGFGYLVDPSTGVRTHVPHVGSVRIGDDVDIGAGTCVDRGKLRDTVIGDGCKIDNLVQIGHNCELGCHVVICGMAALAGSVKLGDRVVIAGQVGLADNIEITADTTIMAQSGVGTNIEQPGVYLGTPAVPRRDAVRQMSAIRKLATGTSKADRS